MAHVTIRLLQDGKSNVWAVEPKMQVEVAAEGEGMKKVRYFVSFNAWAHFRPYCIDPVLTR